MRAVPGALVAHTAEEERCLAAALFGLSGTRTGVAVLLKHPDAVQGAGIASCLRRSTLSILFSCKLIQPVFLHASL